MVGHSWLRAINVFHSTRWTRSIIHLSKHAACGTPKVSTNINVDSEKERPLEGSSPMETKAEGVDDERG